MGSDIPKQFLEIAGRPILLKTLDNAYSQQPKANFILVLPENELETWKQICKTFSVEIPHKLVSGGASRFQSVKNGLGIIQNEAGLTAIHDGVRPFFSPKLLSRLIEKALQYGNATPVMPVVESLRRIEGNESHLEPRQNLYSVQTPQLFETKILLNAYKQAYSVNFTDDASVLEQAGEKIQTVAGESLNIKITTPQDLLFANTLIDR